MARPTNTERINTLAEEMGDLKNGMNQIIAALQGNTLASPETEAKGVEKDIAPASPQQEVPARNVEPSVPHKDDLSAAERAERSPVDFHLSDDGRYLVAKIDLASPGYRTDKQVIHGSTGGWKSFTDARGRKIGLNVMVGTK